MQVPILIRRLMERIHKSDLTFVFSTGGGVVGGFGGAMWGIKDARRTGHGFVWKPVSCGVMGATVGTISGCFWVQSIGLACLADAMWSLKKVTEDKNVVDKE